MLAECFYWIVNMSIAASVTGLAVLAVRAVKALPRRFAVLLWAAPCVRMLVPFGIGSRYSLMSLISRLTTRTVTVYSPVEGVELSVTNSLMGAKTYFPVTYKSEGLKRVFEIGGIIWAVIAAGGAVALLLIYHSVKKEIKDAVLLENNVYLSEKVTSPAVYGVIRPKIILPAPYAEKDLRYILLHENAHIRRADNLWRMIGFFTAAIHWFNPLSWLFLRVFLSDLETACDERAVSELNDTERSEYARTLLDTAAGKDVFVSAFGGAAVRTRIERIVSYKRLTAVSAAVFAAMVFAVLYFLITNAKGV